MPGPMDTDGMAYALVSEVSPGQQVWVDADFECMKPWSKRTVGKNKTGLYLPCKAGCHYLDGQIERPTKDSKMDYYLGIYICEPVGKKPTSQGDK